MEFDISMQSSEAGTGYVSIASSAFIVALQFCVAWEEIDFCSSSLGSSSVPTIAPGSTTSSSCVPAASSSACAPSASPASSGNVASGGSAATICEADLSSGAATAISAAGGISSSGASTATASSLCCFHGSALPANGSSQLRGPGACETGACSSVLSWPRPGGGPAGGGSPSPGGGPSGGVVGRSFTGDVGAATSLPLRAETAASEAVALLSGRVSGAGGVDASAAAARSG
mmetsp:Transcript_106680/g.201051  ORF Transcript_106680/g.201051 Transcript_106680/m.201051 type:complete len:231 (+) Transcript_106680:1487-2179(+)